MDEATRQYLAEQRANEQKNWEGKRPAKTHIESTETERAQHQKFNSDRQLDNSNKQLDLLERIEANTAATHYWVRVIGLPILVSALVATIATILKGCS